jgi:hypothetical protein
LGIQTGYAASHFAPFEKRERREELQEFRSCRSCRSCRSSGVQEFRVQSSEFRVQSSEFRVQSSEFRVQSAKHCGETQRIKSLIGVPNKGNDPWRPEF